ncbi:ABC transporter ATP-binding protein [Legionella micdadei]|uniref:ABC-type dipeptide transporter n=1 Tax=Legionella micdadei TaxID=451 RepID=A0A098GGZ9_LEGMI|nr:ABC transporter ATP-binding protein [Legionella micdadei]ARG96866.1 ABC transporter ATP-binding protein [Legionella micdadei]KTD26548.1 ABC dipeptide/oligopeptide/nickel transport, ATPase component [Legionella micdadei]NSL17862.1 ABC transporter ATP-binding protein [Legionella micdadei]CEG61734.1 Glutathione import ATP-binding protein GsiA [Legionella micdadei]SCY21927.1 peptide/nickel transport system ATP-binding protein [Legionella micdadei]
MKKSAEIKQLSVSFQNRGKLITAVDHLNFRLSPGETLALLGESGCGKSITSLALMRLLPRNAVYGWNSEIRIDNQDILNLPEYLMRTLRGKRIAMIFQEPMTALNPVLTIGEQLVEIVTKHHVAGQRVKARLVELLEKVEMPKPELRLRQYPHQLSGGQKQRVVIAMALAANPEILIADEPTTALDVTIQAQILALLKKLQQQYRMSMLLITHDLGVVKAVADRVCVMYAGQIVEQAAVVDFFTQVLHPYSQQLLASLPGFNKRSQRLQAIPGAVPTLDALPDGCRFHPRCAHAFSICPLIEPQLQVIQGREVRCHLYPDYEQPPALALDESNHAEKAGSDEILLQVKALAVHFSVKRRLFQRNVDPIRAVDGLSFNLYKGKTLALVGESGCGKTTASRALLRLQHISGGEMLYRGQNVRTLKGRALREYRKKVQIIFQDPFSSMNPRMTVGEILAEGMHAQGLSAGVIHKRQQLLLEQVNLPRNSLHRYPHQFSGGQRQRICIARALATEPEVLICDEPTSALDISVQAQILNLLKDLQQETGLSFLFITHNMAVVSYIADEVLVMHNGKMVETGTCETILKYPQHDYTRQLLASVLQI